MKSNFIHRISSKSNKHQYKFWLLLSILLEVEQLQKIIISDNYGKPYIENNAAPKWPNVDDDKIDKSQNKTNCFPLLDEDAVTLLLSDVELK